MPLSSHRPPGRLALVCLAGGWLLGACAAPPPIEPPTAGEVAALRHLEDAAGRVVEQLAAHEELFQRSTTAPLTPDERATLLPLWASMIDHFLAFRSYKLRFLRGWEGAPTEEGQVQALTVGLDAHVTQLRELLELLTRVTDNGALRGTLNDAASEYGIGAGYLDRASVELLSPQSLMMVQIAEDLLRERSRGHFQGQTALDLDLRAAVDHTLAEAKALDRLLNKNAMALVGDTVGVMASNELDKAVNPIIQDIATWLGDTEVRTKGKNLITPAQLDELEPMLRPGDILVERRNWFLSNLGLPGFWPHSELFVDTPEDLAAALDDDPGVRAVFPDGLTAYLQAQFPDAWAAYATPAPGEGAGDGDGSVPEPHRIFEAVGEGVRFNTLTEAALADYIGVMRPTLEPVDRARAIARAFPHWGKPYDFEFDFVTQSKLVCSELVYDAYQAPEGEGRGLDIALSEIMGRITLPPNDLVAQFDEAYGTPSQQLDFVAFLDGDPAAGGAHFATLDDFRASWRRSKWDISQ